MNLHHRNEKLLDSRPRVCFFYQAGFTAAFTYLTSGVFLSGLAILMGAGDVLTSYLSVILNICGVLILGFSAFLERFKSRKRLTIVLTALSRLATLFLVLIPMLVPEDLRLPLFILTVVTAFALQAQAAVVLNQWMVSFTDKNKSGRYISLRQTLVLIVTVILSVAGGSWMDRMDGGYMGFAVLFAAAGLMSVCEIVILLRTPDSEPVQPSKNRIRLKDIAGLPLKDRRFAGFVAYIVAFYLLLYISDSFTTVYMIKYLALPYRTVTLMSMVLSLPQVFLLGIWGKISDRKGHEFVLRASIWIFAGETFFLSFASSGNWYIFLPVAFLISAAANAGFVISVFNRRYELMPKENRIAYDNFYTAVIGAGFILGPFIGGLIKSALEAKAVVTNAIPFAGIRLLYPVSTVGIVLLQFVYFYIQKQQKKKLCCCIEKTA